MSLPNAYLTSVKRLPEIFEAIKNAQAPEKFSQSFIEQLEFKTKADRLVIGVLKCLGFLDDTGKPTERYFRYLDHSQSAKVLAEGIKEAYSDLFAININANTLSKSEIIGKLKTLSQGQLSEGVLDDMATTFLSLVSLADFSSPLKPKEKTKDVDVPKEKPIGEQDKGKSMKVDGLVYNINIVLPETRDTSVYDAIFKSLKEHLG
jgi:hypothetical protein